VSRVNGIARPPLRSYSGMISDALCFQHHLNDLSSDESWSSTLLYIDKCGRHQALRSCL